LFNPSNTRSYPNTNSDRQAFSNPHESKRVNPLDIASIVSHVFPLLKQLNLNPADLQQWWPLVELTTDISQDYSLSIMLEKVRDCHTLLTVLEINSIGQPYHAPILFNLLPLLRQLDINPAFPNEWWPLVELTTEISQDNSRSIMLEKVRDCHTLLTVLEINSIGQPYHAPILFNLLPLLRRLDINPAFPNKWWPLVELTTDNKRTTKEYHQGHPTIWRDYHIDGIVRDCHRLLNMLKIKRLDPLDCAPIHLLIHILSLYCNLRARKNTTNFLENIISFIKSSPHIKRSVSNNRIQHLLGKFVMTSFNFKQRFDTISSCFERPTNKDFNQIKKFNIETNRTLEIIRSQFLCLLDYLWHCKPSLFSVNHCLGKIPWSKKHGSEQNNLAKNVFFYMTSLMIGLNKCKEEKNAQESAQEITFLMDEFAVEINNSGDRTDKTLFITLHCILNRGDAVLQSLNAGEILAEYLYNLKKHCYLRSSEAIPKLVSLTTVTADTQHAYSNETSSSGACQQSCRLKT
jgi:hypothetical protein